LNSFSGFTPQDLYYFFFCGGVWGHLESEENPDFVFHSFGVATALALVPLASPLVSRHHVLESMGRL
jgi:hypothetical protein